MGCRIWCPLGISITKVKKLTLDSHNSNNSWQQTMHMSSMWETTPAHQASYLHRVVSSVRQCLCFLHLHTGGVCTLDVPLETSVAFTVFFICSVPSAIFNAIANFIDIDTSPFVPDVWAFPFSFSTGEVIVCAIWKKVWQLQYLCGLSFAFPHNTKVIVFFCLKRILQISSELSLQSVMLSHTLCIGIHLWL